MLYFYLGLMFVVTRWRKLRTVDFKRFARTREEAESVSFSYLCTDFSGGAELWDNNKRR
jgi:hypothetical protein